MGCTEASTTSIRIPSTRESDQGICGSEAHRYARNLTHQPDRIGPCGLGEMSQELAESVRPKTPPVSSEGAKSKGASSGLVGDEKVTSEVVLRISATDRGDLTKRVQEVKPGTAYFMKKKPSQETRYTSQIRSVMRPSASVAPSTDSISEIQAPSSVPDPAPVVREPAQLTEENLRILEEEVQAKTEEVRRLLPIGQGVLLGKALEKSKEKAPVRAKSRPIGPHPPPGPPSGWRPPPKVASVPSQRKVWDRIRRL